MMEVVCCTAVPCLAGRIHQACKRVLNERFLMEMFKPHKITGEHFRSLHMGKYSRLRRLLN